MEDSQGKHGTSPAYGYKHGSKTICYDEIHWKVHLPTSLSSLASAFEPPIIFSSFPNVGFRKNRRGKFWRLRLHGKGSKKRRWLHHGNWRGKVCYFPRAAANKSPKGSLRWIPLKGAPSYAMRSSASVSWTSYQLPRFPDCGIQTEKALKALWPSQLARKKGRWLHHGTIVGGNYWFQQPVAVALLKFDEIHWKVHLPWGPLCCLFPYLPELLMQPSGVLGSLRKNIRKEQPRGKR